MTTTELRSNRRQQVITIISKLNLYEDEEEFSLADQILSTRLYIILLCIALLVLITFTGLSTQTRIVTVTSPSITDFDHFTNKYPLTLSCSCSQTSIPNKQFLSFNPQYHQICSSGFISQEWISSLFNPVTSDYHPLDFRVIASAQFQTLALLCRTVDQFVSDAIKQFDSSLLISKQTLFRTAFDVQIAVLVDELKANTLANFHRIDRILSLMITESHIVSALRTNYYMKSVPNSEKYDIFSSIYSNKRNLSATSIDELNKCSCETTSDCTFPSGFYNFSESIQLDEIFQSNPSPILFIPGMKTGCLPQNSILQSTLECFFDRTCLDTIVAFTGALSTVSPLNITANSSRFNPNTILSIIFDQMMIESWHNTSNFIGYFNSCAPSICTYSYFQQLSIVYMMTTLVGLIGGLNVAFRMIAPLIIISVIRRLQSKFCSQNHDDVNMITPTHNVRERMIHFLTSLQEKVMTFNIFRKTLIDVQHGIYSTRVYIILLFAGIVILTVYSLVTMHVQSFVVQNPTLEQFQPLHAQYPTMSCPCQYLSIPTSSFFTVRPVFHEVCSSIFVESNDWLKYWPLIPINESEPQIYAFDFRRTGATFFSLLQSFCNVTVELVTNAVNTLYSTQLFRLQAMTPEDFQSYLEAIGTTFGLQLQFSFISLRDFIHTNIRQNQFIIDVSTNSIPISMLVNDTPLFLFMSVDDSYQNPMCFCDSSDPSNPCTRLQGFYCQSSDCHQIDSLPNQTIPGLFQGCYAYESFLSSTLECLYNESCIQMLIDWRLFDYTNMYLPSNLTNITALNLDALNTFSPYTTLDDIMQAVFVDNWTTTESYAAIYTQCQPVACTYTVTERYQLIYVVTTVIGLLGGLAVILRIFVPPFVKILQFVYHYHRRDRQQTQSTAHPCRLFFARAQQTFITLNVYETESNIENQLPAIRIYLVLLMLSMIIVSIFIGLTQQAHTITIDTPSEFEFNNLYSQYPDTLSCPCTTNAIMYATFSEVLSINHPLCSSSFPSSDAWTFPYYSNMTEIDLDGFLLVTHFRLLSSICQLVQDQISTSRGDYAGRNFISLETVSRQSFELQINLINNLFVEEIVNKFRHSFVFISDTLRSNQLQNLYMTNWQTKFSNATENYVLRSIPVSYNNGTCICAVEMSNCSRPLIFKDLYNNAITFPGIVSGCLPIDGLRLSTLECLFDETCVNELNALLNSSIPILLVNSTRFPPNTTQIGTLIDEMFVESWNSTIDYSGYFAQCTPSVCRYSYIERNDIIYILTTLLGLYGGLTVALRLLVWKGLHLFSSLFSHYYRRPRIIDSSTVSTAFQN